MRRGNIQWLALGICGYLYCTLKVYNNQWFWIVFSNQSENVRICIISSMQIEFWKAHPVVAIVTLVLGFVVGLANLRIGKGGNPEISLSSLAIAVLLSGWIGFQGGFAVGHETKGEETVSTRNVSNSERWKIALDLHGGTELLAPFGLGLAFLYVHVRNEKHERHSSISEGSSENIQRNFWTGYKLDSIRMSASIVGCVLGIVLYKLLEIP